ncbi:hypothetical protein [Nocardia thraciensis]
MRTKLLAGVPAVLLLASGLSVLAAPAAEAAPAYTCTAKNHAGEDLQPVTVQAQHGEFQARKRARPEWFGQADFETIRCAPTGGYIPPDR